MFSSTNRKEHYIWNNKNWKLLLYFIMVLFINTQFLIFYFSIFRFKAPVTNQPTSGHVVSAGDAWLSKWSSDTQTIPPRTYRYC